MLGSVFTLFVFACNNLPFDEVESGYIDVSRTMRLDGNWVVDVRFGTNNVAPPCMRLSPLGRVTLNGQPLRRIVGGGHTISIETGEPSCFEAYFELVAEPRPEAETLELVISDRGREMTFDLPQILTNHIVEGPAVLTSGQSVTYTYQPVMDPADGAFEAPAVVNLAAQVGVGYWYPACEYAEPCLNPSLVMDEGSLTFDVPDTCAEPGEYLVLLPQLETELTFGNFSGTQALFLDPPSVQWNASPCP